MKRSSASLLPGFASGWNCCASLRYAFLISAARGVLGHAEDLVVVLVEPLPADPRLPSASAHSLLTRTPAGRITRPRSVYPAAARRPRPAALALARLHQRLVLLGIERLALRVDPLERPRPQRVRSFAYTSSTPCRNRSKSGLSLADINASSNSSSTSSSRCMSGSAAISTASRLLLQHPLAVVVELGLQPPEVVEVLGRLGARQRRRRRCSPAARPRRVGSPDAAPASSAGAVAASSSRTRRLSVTLIGGRSRLVDRPVGHLRGTALRRRSRPRRRRPSPTRGSACGPASPPPRPIRPAPPPARLGCCCVHRLPDPLEDLHRAPRSPVSLIRVDVVALQRLLQRPRSPSATLASPRPRGPCRRSPRRLVHLVGRAGPPGCGPRPPRGACGPRRRTVSASCCIRSISSFDSAVPPVIVICCSLPVARSLALTFTMPFASMSNATSICGMPRGAGGIPIRWNLPERPDARATYTVSASPCRTWISTVVWLSSAVVKISRLAGRDRGVALDQLGEDAALASRRRATAA